MAIKLRLAPILILFGIHPSVGAATLTSETKAAWEAYLQEANAAMQARLQPGAHFLWLDDEPALRANITETLLVP
jgi:membrane-associated protease RseP (regulator of RpoE activity)